MKFDKVDGFQLGQGNFNVNNTSNTPPSKRQKISDSDRSHHKPGSITLQLKPLSLRSPPKSHESNCYRSITNFIGCLIDNNLPNHLKVETLQSNVRDLMRIYLKSSDLYGFILREVRRGLAALKPQSFNQDEHSGLFIRSISEIYSKSESWMVRLIALLSIYLTISFRKLSDTSLLISIDVMPPKRLLCNRFKFK